MSDPTTEIIPSDIVRRVIAIDFEFGKDSDLPYMVGIYNPADDFSKAWGLDAGTEVKVMKEVESLCKGADAIIGHNIFEYDLKHLPKGEPYTWLHRMPIIDTLELSPLAFPRWPYHKLIKDYKLVSHSKNRPDEDAKLAWTLFNDEVITLQDRSRIPEVIFAAYERWFTDNDRKGGYHKFFEMIRDARKTASGDLPFSIGVLGEMLRDRACSTKFSKIFGDPRTDLKAKAYALSWLYGADEFSVLSRWVRVNHPEIQAMLDALRDQDCARPECSFCRSSFDLNSHLNRFFGYDSLRPNQEEITERMVNGENIIAVLPTAGGKSLCFQLPALINAKRRKMLTIVVSPLQALMKDQVDNLRKRHVMNAGAIYSGITPQERKELLDGIESGKVDLVYVAPEQLRNRTFISKITQREIASWIIDEAHCISKWGHDFRPDYLYLPKVINKQREQNKARAPQVACFTATAKNDVIDEIKAIFQEQLGIGLLDINKGHERKELRYSTHEVDENAKVEKLIDLLADERGDAIVYVAKKKTAEKVAEALNNSEVLQELGRKAAHFHSKVEPEEKKSIQDRFIKKDGDLDIIVATNAFGMGIDKPDVRLVVHFDIPGSLESYLQEAGRAGRDGNTARCVLLYSPGDIEAQFQLKTLNRITKKEVGEIFKGIKNIDRKTKFSGDLTVTAGEILMEDDVDTDFDIGEPGTETKVKTALAVLEESGLLERKENYYNVYEVSHMAHSIEEVSKKFDGLNLSEESRKRYEAVYDQLLFSGKDDVINVDRIAYETCIKIKDIPRILQALDSQGIIKLTTKLVVYVSKGVAGDARSKLEKLNNKQEALFHCIKNQENGWDEAEAKIFNIRLTTTELQKGFPDMEPEQVTQLLRNFHRLNILETRRRNNETFNVKIKMDYAASKEIIGRSRDVSILLLDYIYRVIDKPPVSANHADNPSDEHLFAVEKGQHTGSHLRAEFTLEDLDEFLKQYLHEKSREERVDIINDTLLFLNDNGVLRIGRGLAVLKTAMRVILPTDKKRRQIKFERLLEYYKEQIFQVHVIEAYARKAVEAILEALEFVADYFRLSREDFRNKYFPDMDDEELQRPVSPVDYHKIVEELGNKHQEEIVKTRQEGVLIIAGPGSGKTRTIVHRAAYLLKVERVKPSNILIVAFNREAVNEIKVRLRKLVRGSAPAYVDIYTYHGIAMRLTGKAYSSANRNKGDDENYFKQILKDSVEILEKSRDEEQEDWEERRRKLLKGYSHILVDEYQDIDEDCYRLISAIAGRNTDTGSRLNIIAVGDDDQNIYSWKGSNVEFIHNFEKEYKAEVVYLTENYRSTKAIIGASNQLISRNGQRMKAGENEVRIDSTRTNDPAGGRWETIDNAMDCGRVTVLDINNTKDQGGAIVHEIIRRKQLDPAIKFSDIAVLARGNEEAMFISEAFKTLRPAIPTRHPSPVNIPFPMYREAAKTIDLLEMHKDEIKKAGDIGKIILTALKDADKNIWINEVLRKLVVDFTQFNGMSSVSSEDWEQYLWDYAATQKWQIPDVDAVLVTTIHQAKGKEFNQVFLLDPGNSFNNHKQGQSIEDERRLYYVGLTRAKELACVLKVGENNSPFADEVLSASEFTARRKGVIHEEWQQVVSALPERPRFEYMGLSNIWASSFALQKSKWFERDKVQSLLKDLPIGAPLEFRLSDPMPDENCNYVDIYHDGLKLGRLAQATAKRYQEPDRVKVEVAAVIRYLRDEGDTYATLDKYFAVLPKVTLIK